jgi:hypothetical protein
VGFGSFAAIQRTLSALATAILAGSIDGKVSGRLLVDVQQAIRLQKMLTTQERRHGEVPGKPVRSMISREAVEEKKLHRPKEPRRRR